MCVCLFYCSDDGGSGLEVHTEDYCEMNAREYFEGQLRPGVNDAGGLWAMSYICEIEVRCLHAPALVQCGRYAREVPSD